MFVSTPYKIITMFYYSKNPTTVCKESFAIWITRTPSSTIVYFTTIQTADDALEMAEQTEI